MPDRIWLEIDLGALRRNYRTLARSISPAALFPVIKADAYNLGAGAVARTLCDYAPTFCVATPAEALEIISYGKNVRLLGALLNSEVADVVHFGMVPSVPSLEVAEMLSAEAVRQRRTLDVMIKLDTGMGRLGLLPDEAPEAIAKIAALPNLRCTDIFSHFPVGYRVDHPMTQEQLRLFRAVLNAVAERHIMIPNVHFANSDAIGCLPESVKLPYNCARTGISLYGFSPDPKLAAHLEPVVHCYSHVIAVRRLPKGHNVGYECTCTLPEDTDIALVSAGYADGLPLQLSNHAEFLIRGRRCPVLGRVCMDYTMVSLAPLGGELPYQGELVTLIGTDTGETVSPEEWAKLKGTHVYDILCSFGGRMERRYVFH